MTENASDQVRERLRWRHVETPCGKCGGAGGRLYGSGATWRGGMGTASITWDVCDACWGSGDANKPWVDLRKLRDEVNQRVTERAANLFVDRLGLRMEVMRKTSLLLADELDKQSRRRKPPTGESFFARRNWEAVCMGLASMLREMAQGGEE